MENLFEKILVEALSLGVTDLHLNRSLIQSLKCDTKEKFHLLKRLSYKLIRN